MNHRLLHPVAWMAAGSLLAGGIAVAQTGGGSFVAADGSVTACAHKRNGKLRVVKPGKACKRAETRLALGQRGPAGATGAAGTNGSNGTNGAAGAAGATGPAGPFPDTLPSGKTLTGVFNIAWQAAAMGEYHGDSITFAYPLASGPTVNVLYDGTTPTANCPGTRADPQALAGHLCIYRGASAKIDLPGGIATGNPVTGTENEPTTSRFGAYVEGISNASGFVYVTGTWAVTAP